MFKRFRKGSKQSTSKTTTIPALPAPALNHWKFEEKDIHNYSLRIRYSALHDAYYFNEDLKTPAFKEYQTGLTKNSKCMYRKVEHDWRMVYLSREDIPYDETLIGIAEWDFNLPFTLITDVKIKAVHTLFQNGTVDWTVSVDGKKYKEVGLGSNTYINITSDLKELSKGEPIHYFLLRATLAKGKGAVAWQHAQLFRQPLADKDEFPFDVIIATDPPPSIKVDSLEPMPPLAACPTKEIPSLFNDKATADLTLIIDKKPIYVHKEVLSKRSEYFAAMFASGMKEVNQKELVLNEVSYDSLCKLVEISFLSTFNCNSDKLSSYLCYSSLKSKGLTLEMLLDLLKVSSEYSVLPLMQLCESLISEQLTVDNVNVIAEAAEVYGADQLRDYCTWYRRVFVK